MVKCIECSLRNKLISAERIQTKVCQAGLLVGLCL